MSNDYRDGFESAKSEGFTAETARAYLSMVEPDGSEYDRGHRAAVQWIAEH